MSKVHYIWGVPLLFFAMICLSSAAVVFYFMEDVNPIIKAEWRFQITFIIAALISIKEWHREREQVIQMWKDSWQWILISGISLAAFFICWVYSLEMTTIAHSLLFSDLDPLIIIIGSSIVTRQANYGLFAGGLVAVAGLCGIAFSYKDSSAEGTIFGDLLALLGSFLIVGYVLVGKMLRQSRDVPLFSYVSGIYFVAWLITYILSWAVDLKNAGEIFGWTDLDVLPYALWLGIVPGFVGHATINYLMKYLSPVIISIFGQLEPVIGAFLGWCFGYQQNPSNGTWIGAILIISGCTIVVFADYHAPKMKNEEDETPYSAFPDTPHR